MMDMLSIFLPLSSIYVALAIYIYNRVRALKKMPPELRKQMTFSQRMLFLYGFYKTPVGKDIQETAGDALESLNKSWQEMEKIFQRFDDAFRKKRQEMVESEQHLSELQKEIQAQNDKLMELNSITPEAAQLVSNTIAQSSRKSLWQQIIISFVFFVLGVASTIIVTLLIKS